MYSPISADAVQSQSTIKNILKSFNHQKITNKNEKSSAFLENGSRVLRTEQSLVQSSSSFRSSSSECSNESSHSSCSSIIHQP
jgi:hypothetical protein